ncbi:hypothetical protein [Mesorhizobium carmichaelinearum]|uniref:hypothetical protein n=1 Tax=Mesorhizobium carmichaelinearum TaxID=1208188 RepID=UPI000BA37506|nr:hypothetical protein [Mesorhizobium carmichaelinearum]
MNIRAQQLLSRIPDHPSTASLRTAALECLALSDRFGARAAAIKADPSFTAIGREKAVKDEAAKTFLPGLQVAYAPIARALASAKQARAAIFASAFPQPDPTNIAAALERQEIRALVRELKPGERMAFISGSRDERVADAVLSAPPVLSGLSDDMFGQFRDLVMERRVDGGQVAEIQKAEEAAEAAQAAMIVARNDIRTATGLPDRAFEDLQKSSAPTPWLKQAGDQVVKVIPGEMTYPAASADDLALGKFYANADEYFAENPGARIAATPAAA